MTELRTLVVLGVVAVVAAIVAVAAGPDFDIALVLGGIAALLGGLVALLALGGQVRRTAGPAEIVDSAVVRPLRDSLTSGSLGRQRVIAAVQAVERAASGGGFAPIGIDEERRLLGLPPEAFRRWLSGELDRLERET
jgi:hypothetical protein